MVTASLSMRIGYCARPWEAGTAVIIATPHFSVQFPFFSSGLASERLAKMDAVADGVTLF